MSLRHCSLAVETPVLTNAPVLARLVYSSPTCDCVASSTTKSTSPSNTHPNSMPHLSLCDLCDLNDTLCLLQSSAKSSSHLHADLGLTDLDAAHQTDITREHTSCLHIEERKTSSPTSHCRHNLVAIKFLLPVELDQV